MALSIVADGASVPSQATGIVKSTYWFCDAYVGSADALIQAGHITAGELAPQPGRPLGKMAFLSSGEPCPPSRRAWREPGYKTISLNEDGTYRVEVTVSKELQAWRRKQDAAADAEREQQRIVKEIAEDGHKYRNWTLRHEYGGGSESWEGTKAQLQAEGIGVGLNFPGEPGAPEELQCKCPLGFDVRVFLPTYPRAKAAAGIYMAQSFYVPRVKHPKQYVTHARGVLREVWSPDGWLSSDFYTGSAEALVDAGLVPDASYFPGKPSRNKVQCAYRKDWTPATTANGQDWGATLHKRGKHGQFAVELPVTSQEEERRRAARKALEEEVKRDEESLAAERRQLRQAADRTEKSVEEFRAERARFAEISLKFLFSEVFGKSDGALSFDIEEGGEAWEDLAHAFQTIRDAVQQVNVLRDGKHAAAVHTRLKLVAARNDKGLQSVLQSAKALRLVHSAPDGEQE